LVDASDSNTNPVKCLSEKMLANHFSDRHFDLMFAAFIDDLAK
jgi:hypothetical protein